MIGNFSDIQIQIKGGDIGRRDTINFNLLYLRRGEGILPSKLFKEVKSGHEETREPTLKR